jgi:hypothetical protein
MYRDNESFMNWTEARMLATRDARFRTKLNALLAEKARRDRQVHRIFLPARRRGAPGVRPAMAIGFMSLFQGVRLAMLSSPADMTAEQAESVLSLFVESIMQLARWQGSASR